MISLEPILKTVLEYELNMNTPEQRRYHVAQMRANFALEGFSPDANNQAMQEQYINGENCQLDLFSDKRIYCVTNLWQPHCDGHCIGDCSNYG